MALARAQGDRERDSAWPVVVAVVLTLGLSGQPGVRQGGRQLLPELGEASITESSQRKAGAAPAGPGTSRGAGHEWGTAERRGLGPRGCTCALRQEEKRAGLLGVNTNWEHVSTELRDYVRQRETQLEWALGLLHVLLSCTFLLVLHASFSYTDSYNADIRFDNIYISTYFCQIDERRKKLGKRTLLPLRKAEKKAVIFPYDPAIQALEMKNLAATNWR